MSKDDKEKPGALHSFFGGLLLTIVLVVIVPVVSAILIEPYVIEAIGDTEFGPFTNAMFITAAMLLILILFILLLGGGRIFKKYGVIGVIGLIAAYWYLDRILDAVIPVLIIIIFVAIAYYRDGRKQEKEGKKQKK